MTKRPVKDCAGACGRKNLPLALFYRRRGALDGHYSECKNCMRAKRIQRYRADKIPDVSRICG